MFYSSSDESIIVRMRQFLMRGSFDKLKTHIYMNFSIINVPPQILCETNLIKLNGKFNYMLL